jgi:hypothetical protein
VSRAAKPGEANAPVTEITPVREVRRQLKRKTRNERSTDSNSGSNGESGSEGEGEGEGECDVMVLLWLLNIISTIWHNVRWETLP